jgi:hypothetical protein
MVEHLQSPWHLETDEMATDAIHGAGWTTVVSHGVPPSAASRRATAS